MFDIVEDVAPWCADQVEFAIATVTRTWSSAPRMVGAAMALSAHGEVIGSVSGGCVEGAVLEVCQEVLRTGASAQVKYGVSNEDAFETARSIAKREGILAGISGGAAVYAATQVGKRVFSQKQNRHLFCGTSYNFPY